jgi:uncharacterized protein
MLPSIDVRLAQELSVRASQVSATIALIDEGATVPFIARYRKEVTGGLDDTQLRDLAERLIYLRELEDRRAAVLASIEGQGKLTDALKNDIENAETKQRLEDLYLPYKPKRRTKAQIAREAGLAPLAELLFTDPTQKPETAAASYLNADAGFADVKAVLDGARQILMEQFSEDATLLGELRDYLSAHGVVVSAVVAGKENEGAKFRDYFEYREPLNTIPSHRALALFRGRNEGVLQVALKLDTDLAFEDANTTAGGVPLRSTEPNPCEKKIAAHFHIANRDRPADKWLADTVRWTWRTKLFLHLELELTNVLRERAEEEAIRIFAHNLKDLLLASPAGPRATLGLDPGLRTGVKVAAVDATGKLLERTTIYPHEPRRDWDGSLATLAALCARHHIELIAIGNGTASRETDKLAGELQKRYPELRVTKVVVSEAGASVYSASAFAAKEFPELDVSLRGAVSIARRLQDPLAELVKIEPKSIGVGQYQHDVSQIKLAKSLDGVVEDCVNAVGVDVNTASVPLLARIAGLSPTLAQNIVTHRDENGAFKVRDELLKVARLGNKTFEQAAGFLRIPNGDNPLDASAVHPEAYPVVEKILADLHKPIRDVIGNADVLKQVSARRYTDEKFGEITVTDILKELEKPGRDPRPEFKTATFSDIEDIRDLRPGMVLEGAVTNVAAFGAFVDIGVHQDGLVHVSALANRFVKDPHEVVKAGDIVKVKVMEVDVARQRIALSMRLQDDPDTAPKQASGNERSGRDGGRKFDGKKFEGKKFEGKKFDGRNERRRDAEPETAMAAAFAKFRNRG